MSQYSECLFETKMWVVSLVDLMLNCPVIQDGTVFRLWLIPFWPSSNMLYWLSTGHVVFPDKYPHFELFTFTFATTCLTYGDSGFLWTPVPPPLVGRLTKGFSRTNSHKSFKSQSKMIKLKETNIYFLTRKSRFFPPTRLDISLGCKSRK